MSSEMLESKKFYMEKVQKTINKKCFNKCFTNERVLNKNCYIVCYDKFVKSIQQTYEEIKLLSRKHRSVYHFRIFSEIDPYMYITYDPNAVEYKLGRLNAVYCSDLFRKKSF